MKNSFIYSLKHSLPIFISFVPVGLVYGILMKSNGYDWYWSSLCSITVFAGSLQYLMIDFFSGSTPLITVVLMAFLLNSRHIFYGLPFIEKWRDYGLEKLFLIYALPDETFSLHVSAKFDESLNEKHVYFFNAILVLFYWVLVSTIGGLLGSMITFNTNGMDFAITGLFIVIVIEQLYDAKSIWPFVVAVISSVLCLLSIGPDYFIFPSLIISIIMLFILRPKLEVKYDD